jgi:hypothetical protein
MGTVDWDVLAHLALQLEKKPVPSTKALPNAIA